MRWVLSLVVGVFVVDALVLLCLERRFVVSGGMVVGAMSSVVGVSVVGIRLVDSRLVDSRLVEFRLFVRDWRALRAAAALG